MHRDDPERHAAEPRATAATTRVDSKAQRTDRRIGTIAIFAIALAGPEAAVKAKAVAGESHSFRAKHGSRRVGENARRDDEAESSSTEHRWTVACSSPDVRYSW